jgi:hypothetical protein
MGEWLGGIRSFLVLRKRRVESMMGRFRLKVVDQITGSEYSMQTRFLSGTDGGRSLVAKRLGPPFTSMPGGNAGVQCACPR